MSLLGVEPSLLGGVRGNAAEGRPHALSHHLLGHRLLRLEAIAELADRLPASAVEHHRADLPDLLPGGGAPQLAGVTPGDMVRGMDSNGCWLVLWNIEQDRDYAALLDACLDELEPQITPGPRAALREGFIFISSPRSVTPLHADPEHNVLLQIRGTKTMTVGRWPSDDIRGREIERLCVGGDRNLLHRAVGEEHFPLEPGRAVYVPPFAPHRVANGSEVCISLSVTWRPAEVLRREQLYVVNARLRRLGLRPRPPGAPGPDRAKLALLAAGRGAKNGVRRLAHASSAR